MKDMQYLNTEKTVIQIHLEEGDLYYQSENDADQYLSIEPGHKLWNSVLAGDYGEIAEVEDALATNES
jgi:hypothetical protein